VHTKDKSNNEALTNWNGLCLAFSDFRQLSHHYPSYFFCFFVHVQQLSQWRRCTVGCPRTLCLFINWVICLKKLRTAGLGYSFEERSLKRSDGGISTLFYKCKQVFCVVSTSLTEKMYVVHTAQHYSRLKNRCNLVISVMPRMFDCQLHVSILV